jgi:hypothetical protein
MEASMEAKTILHYETAQRARHLNNYTDRVNSEASALIKFGTINKYPIEWAIKKLNPTGDVPRDKMLDDRAKRIRVFSRDEKRSFKSGSPTATRSNTIYTTPKTPAVQMTEVQVDCEGERYYMWVDLSQSVLVVGQAWLGVKFGRDYSEVVAGCSTMKPFVRFANSMLPWGQTLQEVCNIVLLHFKAVCLRTETGGCSSPGCFRNSAELFTPRSSSSST